MITTKAFAILNPTATQPLTFDRHICIGCNICVDICQVDILVPNPEVGEPPIILYPGECWYDGSCVFACPEPGAITLNSMASKRVHFQRKASGEDFFV
ncbi:ferredoxin family protein [Gemmatimonadota bacterium]